MLATSDTTLASAQGGANWFKPMKFVAQKGTGLFKEVPFKTAGGGVINYNVEGKYVLDKALQNRRIAGTAAIGTAAIGTAIGVPAHYALKPGQGGEAQTRSIEQLTGLA